MQTATTQQQVTRLLQWSDQRYAEFIFECGTAYLQHYTRGEGQLIISHIMRSRIFWNWWKMEWELRDRAFIESQVIPLKLDNLLAIYRALHDPAALAGEMTPSGLVLRESYNTMIAELNQEALTVNEVA